MHRIIQGLREEHGHIISVLYRLSSALDALRTGAEPDLDALEAALGELTAFPDAIHHPKEELLFERLCRRLGNEPPLIGRLRGEHVSLGRLGSALGRRLAGREIDETLRQDGHDYVRAQRWHISQEESGLYRLAESTLSGQDWLDLETEVRDRFGDDAMGGSSNV